MTRRSIALWLLLISPLFSVPGVSAPLKTVMADYSGAVKWPLSMILPGAFSAHSVFTTNLYVNGVLFIPTTTNYILVISGIASNQIGSLTAPIDVSDDPQINEALMFNGVTAEWVSASNMIFNGDSVFSGITLGGQKITSWSDITNEATVITGDIIANSVDAPIIQGTVGSFSNLLAPVISAEELILNNISITNWSDITNGMLASGGDVTVNSITSGTVTADSIAATNIAALSISSTQFILNSVAISDWSSITGSADWARSAASTNVNAGGNEITNASKVVLSDGTIISSDISANSITCSAAQAIWVNASNVTAPVVSAAEMILDGVSITNWGDITNGALIYGSDIYVNSVTSESVTATEIVATNVTAEALNVNSMVFNGTTITNINQSVSNYTPYSYSSFSVMDSTGQVSAVQMDARYGKSRIEFRNADGAGKIEFASNTFYFSSASSNDIIVNSGVLATGTPIYAESDPLWEAARQSVADMLVVNASNIMAPVVSAEELILNGSSITDWSSVTGSADWARSAASTNINAGNHDLTNVYGIVLSGVRISSWGEVTNRDNWSAAAAATNANLGGHDITNAKNMTVSGYISAGAITSDSISIDSLSLSNEPISNWSQLTNRENWSADAASGNVDVGGNTITNALEIILSDGSVLSADLAVSSLTCSAVQATWVNSSNVTAPVVSAEELILDGIGVTSWSSITGSADWARSAASSDVDFGDHYITNSSGIYISDYLVTNWAQLTNAENWSRLSADGNVNIGGHYMTNISAISLAGALITNWNQLTNTANWSLTAAAEDINVGGNSITNLFAIFLNDIGITNWAQLTNRANWSAAAASGNVNVGGNFITNISKIYLDGVGVTNWAQLTNRANWSADAASSDVDLDNNDLINVSSMSMSGGAHIAGDTAVGSLTCSLVQATVINSSNITSGVVSADEIILNGDAKTAWPDPAGWSASAAASDINAGGYAMTNLSGISIGSEMVTNWSDIAAIYSTNFNLVTNTVFTDNADVNGFNLTNVGTLYFQGGGRIAASGGTFEFGE